MHTHFRPLTSLGILMLTMGPALAEQGRTYSFTLGLGAAYAPLYEGSNRSETNAFPIIDISLLDDRVFIGTEGLGYRFVNTPDLMLSAALGYGGERKVSDDPRNLAGLGNLKSETLGILSAEYRLGTASFGAEVTHGADYGTTADLKLGAGVEISQQISIGGEISATYADDDHMTRYFGVSGAQSATSGLTAFTAGSGFKSAGIGLSMTYGITESSALIAGVSYQKLMGDAGKSPITRDKGQTSTFLGLTTRF